MRQSGGGKCEGAKAPFAFNKTRKSNFSKLDFYRAACQKDFFDRLNIVTCKYL